MTVTGSSPFPFITKDGSLSSFKTVGAAEFNQDFNYGDVITGSYPYETGISSDFFPDGLYYNSKRKFRLLALKNTFNYHALLSPHYSFKSDLGDKETQQLRLISIPSIYYGESIRKKSVSCKWYFEGDLIAELQDSNGNGELVQVGPEGSLGSGSVAGVVLYNEGFLCITGSWDLHATHTDNFDIYNPSSLLAPAWKFFMTTGSMGNQTVVSSSFSLDFDGTERIPVMTMMAKAEKGEFNYSNNQTFIERGQETTPETGSIVYKEKENLKIKNIISSEYDDQDPALENTTYISKVAIYDKEKNLIGVAKLATPARKKQNDDITIKMKLDM